MTSVSDSVWPSYIRAPLREMSEANKLNNTERNELCRLFHALQQVQGSPVRPRIDVSRSDTGFTRRLIAQSVQAVTSFWPDRLVWNGMAGSMAQTASSAAGGCAALHQRSAMVADRGLCSRWRDPLVFPAASADPVHASLVPTPADIHFFSYNSTGENAALASICDAGEPPACLDRLTTGLRAGRLLADKDLMVSTQAHAVRKRAALDRPQPGFVLDDQVQTGDDHCHIRTTTVAGTTIGDSLLVTGEYLRNPLLGAVEKVKEAVLPGHPLSETESMLAEIGNVVQDIALGFFTSGAYPILKYGAAKSSTVIGHSINGDKQCVRKEFSAEEMAQLLFDTEVGITTTGLVHSLPDELSKTNRFMPKGLFVQEHVPTRVHTEKYLTIRRHGEDILIREKSPGHFVTHHPHAARPERLEQRVFFDARTRQVFFDRHFPEGSGYDFNIADGRNFVSIHGQHHELRYNWDARRPEIHLQVDGKTTTLPVYMEKLSHTWHLAAHNGRQLFGKKRCDLIDKIRLSDSTGYALHATDNLNPSAYGSGKIVELRRQGAFSSEAPQMQAVELKGELVPVRMRVTPAHGVRYEVYDAAAPEGAGHPIAWDGSRWTFEQATSVHVADALKQMIGPRMFRQDIRPRDLSAPDQHGLQWDKDNNSYLKVNHRYVQVHHYVTHPAVRNRYYIQRNQGDPLVIRFRGNRFHKETHRERLSHLMLSGLNGNRYSARDWLTESVGGDTPANREWAENLLSQFRFPQHSPATDIEFARHVFEWDGGTPSWAETYRVRTHVVKDTAGQDTQLTYYPKHLIGEGVEGHVYADADDDGYLVKAYFSDLDDPEPIREAAAQFSRYYGDGAAQVFQGENNMFMRMKRIQGTPLHQVKTFAPGAADLFDGMLKKLADAGIYHSDLKPDNVLWDDTKKVFQPIDFGIRSGEQLAGVDAEDLLDRMRFNTEDIIDLIRRNTI